MGTSTLYAFMFQLILNWNSMLVFERMVLKNVVCKYVLIMKRLMFESIICNLRELVAHDGNVGKIVHQGRCKDFTCLEILHYGNVKWFHPIYYCFFGATRVKNLQLATVEVSHCAQCLFSQLAREMVLAMCCEARTYVSYVSGYKHWMNLFSKGWAAFSLVLDSRDSGAIP